MKDFGAGHFIFLSLLLFSSFLFCFTLTVESHARPDFLGVVIKPLLLTATYLASFPLAHHTHKCLSLVVATDFTTLCPLITSPVSEHGALRLQKRDGLLGTGIAPV